VGTRQAAPTSGLSASGCMKWSPGAGLFKGEDVSETLASVFKDEPPWDDAPPRVRRLLKKCLERDPKRRLSDIADAWGLAG